MLALMDEGSVLRPTLTLWPQTPTPIAAREDLTRAAEEAIRLLPVVPYRCVSPTNVDRDNKDLCAICLVRVAGSGVRFRARAS